MNQPIIFSAKGISANTPGTLRVKPDGEVSAGTVGESVTNCFIAKFKKYVDPVLKDASMKSMNPKSLNLTVAVLTAIRKFDAAKLNFSAHDVTKSLRTEVEVGNLDVTDVKHDFASAFPVPAGSMVANIEHGQVREIVKSLFDENFIPDYKPGTGRTAGGSTYVEYQYQDPKLAVVQKSYTPPAQPTPVAVPLTPNMGAGNAFGQTVRSEAVRKALAYIENRLNEGRRPTLKATQSSIRRNPLSCEEIRKEALLAGYGILAGSTASLDAVVRR